MTGQPATTRRRTQAERRSRSRERLLEAAVLCLAERGYTGTTFGAVLERAGMSNGAMWRHFRSRADLLVAATLQSMRALRELQPEPAMDAMPPAIRLDATVDRLCALLNEPPFQALIELLLASRTDDELRVQLAATDRDAGDLFFESVARLVGPGLAAHPHFRRNVRAIALNLYGAALTAGLRAPTSDDQLSGELRELARGMFGFG